MKPENKGNVRNNNDNSQNSEQKKFRKRLKGIFKELNKTQHLVNKEGHSKRI